MKMCSRRMNDDFFDWFDLPALLSASLIEIFLHVTGRNLPLSWICGPNQAMSCCNDSS